MSLGSNKPPSHTRGSVPASIAAGVFPRNNYGGSVGSGFVSGQSGPTGTLSAAMVQLGEPLAPTSLLSKYFFL